GKIWGERARHTRFAAGAAKQAVGMSGILDDKGLDPTRFGVYLCCGEGSQDFISFSRMLTASLTPDGIDLVKFMHVGMETLDPVQELEQEPNMPTSHLAAMFNAQGPNANCL